MTKDPIVKRDETIRAIILAALVIAFGLTFALSARPFRGTVKSWVLPVAPLPARANLPELRSMIYATVPLTPKDWRTPFFQLGKPADEKASTAEPDPVMGYSIREIDALGMPFGAYKEYGYTLYLDTGPGFYAYPLADEGLNQIAEKAGRHVEAGYSPPLWKFYWGWLFILGVAGWGWFELGAARRRRELSGVI